MVAEEDTVEDMKRKENMKLQRSSSEVVMLLGGEKSRGGTNA